ncbi:uncharacterized protein si:dkey-9i23.16 [Carassius carassius]|uniref:uncharacterized protein si:dkey-9i23.16 n=1 Tax=Carassius carassius TaxID=217509 RepID=UPI002868A4F7|nr:uncharacterized protein si:dkey-9i23.16 [Carassius carassius]XP_059410379.1 uncharacterized protein si:dkey-9i23.16 [Carassius carassius]XP_059410380.1 uncharacterized protein si:dkey-9i23.16 [Carassius carassius]XP_059410381.1 uncharacterized protein si:dkey-9i23.16 [Carassius carassius]XP_059410382.1 uncharacterized protein si:dkey-9i23.16 [Carassius carassius]
MSSNQMPSADSDPPKFHRLFKFYDPEVVALTTILLGLFQLLLTIPAYSISIDIKYFFICPLCVGSVSVTAGSFGMASERTPKRELLKNSLIFGLAGLVGTLIGLVLYGYAASISLDLPPCSLDEYSCPETIFQSFYKAISGQLLFYNIAALVLHCFLSFSAFKGLRIH